MQLAFRNLSKKLEKDLNQIITASLLAVDPYKCVENHLFFENNTIIIDGIKYDLHDFNKVYLVGYGKAVIPMAAAVMHTIGSVVEKGVIITKHHSDKFPLPSKIKILTGDHPVPSKKSLNSTKTLIHFLKSTNEEDLIINLVSGGGSALLTTPSQGLSMNDIQEVTSALLACGADIQEINTIRKHIDDIKGGGLARLAGKTHIISLVISDVLGDDISMIASGPTYPDMTTYQDALRIIQKYQLEKNIPSKVISHLEKGIAGEIAETMKVNDLINKTKVHHIIGSLSLSIQASAKIAKKLGYNAQIISTNIVGEAREIGKMGGSILKTLATTDLVAPKPAILIGGGETTVNIHGKGKGGRNQEIAFGAMAVISASERCVLVALATDGEDGPTNAAGAYVTGQTLQCAIDAGLNPDIFGNNNDTYSFFKALNNLIVCGPTGTNVNDLLFLIAY